MNVCNDPFHSDRQRSRHRSPLHRLPSGGAILCFHSITARGDEEYGDAHLALDDFALCVRLARHWGEFVPLSELIARHIRGESTAGLLAATFDDGYAALQGEFSEFVERAGIPIAIFAVTDAASDGQTYWWDRVDNLFPRIARDRWRAFEDACGVCEEYRTGQPREYGPLRPLRQWILATYAGRWPPHLEHELERLEREAGYRTHQRAMTFEELSRFAAMPGVEVGVHTVSHPVLPLLSDSEIEQEIVTAHDTLREHVANTIPVLALPFGLYDERTLRLAASAGMSACLTLSGETLGSSALPSGVPRICITKTDSRAKLNLRLLGVPRLVRAICGRRLEPFPALPSATT
ncbi:MAG TPA: polysaccharide deacetylase family protein [Vicinamibacterales bacterium]|nr:polysaccharide deacetylase family protein [Vicinamibacterales bacterium]